MMNNMIRKLIPIILSSFIFSQSNPIDIATSGAIQLRMNGQLNFTHNPATLGYMKAPLKNNKPIQEDAVISDSSTISVEEDKAISDSTTISVKEVKAISVSTTISVEEGKGISDSTTISIEEGKAISDSATLSIEEDVVISDSTNISVKENTTIPDSETISIEEDVAIVDSLIVEKVQSSSNFSMSIFNLSFGIGSGLITPDWINNQLFGGRDLRNSKERKDFLNGISSDMNIQIPLASSLPILNFSFGSHLISLGQVRSYTSLKIPSALAQIPFKGLDKGEELEINDVGIQHITYFPVSYSKGFVLNPGIIPYSKKSYAGIRAKLLVGLAELHTENISGMLLGTETHTMIDAEIEMKGSLPISIDESIPKGSMAFGVGLDLGFITEINDKITLGINIDNLIASLKWSGATIYNANITGELTPEELSEIDSLSNHLDQSEKKEVGNYKTNLPMSINLSSTYFAKEWMTIDANIRLDIGNTYWASKTPLLSVGSEFNPGSKFPIYFGISLGGHNGFNWGTGVSIKMGPVIMDIGGGQDGGVFNNATGMRLGLGLRIEK